MADLTARIKPKKSSTASEVPQAADLEVAELAVNTADGKLFTKHTDNSIKTIGGGAEGLTDLTDVSLQQSGKHEYNVNTSLLNSAGEWYASSNSNTYFWGYSAANTDLRSAFASVTTGTVFDVEYTRLSDGQQVTVTVEMAGAFNVYNTDGYNSNLPRQGGGNSVSYDLNTLADKTQPVYLSGGPFPSSDVPAATGEVLTWNDSISQWQPSAPAVDSNTTTAGTGSSAISNIVTISQVDYDALATPDANTIYFIV